MADAPHIWKDAEIKTIGDLIDAMCALQTPEEAQQFMAGYRAINEHADANVGYCTGYLGGSEMRRLQEWCDVAHPIFGKSSPTPDEALEAGKEWARG